MKLTEIYYLRENLRKKEYDSKDNIMYRQFWYTIFAEKLVMLRWIIENYPSQKARLCVQNNNIINSNKSNALLKDEILDSFLLYEKEKTFQNNTIRIYIRYYAGITKWYKIIRERTTLYKSY